MYQYLLLSVCRRVVAVVVVVVDSPVVVSVLLLWLLSALCARTSAARARPFDPAFLHPFVSCSGQIRVYFKYTYVLGKVFKGLGLNSVR